jgi:hypothetical protein
VPGGWPVIVTRGAVGIDLPADVTHAQALAFNHTMGRLDGVEHIDEDGTVHFTPSLKAAIAPHWPDLAEPLVPADAQARYARLHQAMALAP